jgi:hypothetical protein
LFIFDPRAYACGFNMMPKRGFKMTQEHLC